MPEYTVAGLAFLAGAVGWASSAGMLRLRATWYGFAAFLVMTAIFDLVLTGLPIVTYGAGSASGIALGTIPVEDFLYGQALYLVAVTAWGSRSADERVIAATASATQRGGPA